MASLAVRKGELIADERDDDVLIGWTMAMAASGTNRGSGRVLNVAMSRKVQFQQIED